MPVCKCVYFMVQRSTLCAHPKGIPHVNLYTTILMVFIFTLSTQSVNSYGFITKTDGINLVTFMQNPVMLFDHNTSLVISRWANIRKEGTQLLAADAEFDAQGAPFAQHIKSKVAQGFWKSTSISCHYNWDTIVKNGQAGTHMIMGSTLLEVSIVATPEPGKHKCIHPKTEKTIQTVLKKQYAIGKR